MRPSDGRIRLWPAAVTGFIVVLLLIGISTGVRLNTAAPSDFVALRVSSERANDAMAGAYWELAVNVIQRQYNRVSELPEQAPESFRLPGESSMTATAAQRDAYWKKLRGEWLRSENWHRVYGFDLSWVLNDAVSVMYDIRDFVGRT